MSRCVDLDERVTAQFYDEECEEWTTQTCTIADVLDSVCDEYTVLPSAQPEQRWIPITEGPPKKRDWYLGIFKEPDTGWINPIPFICDYVGKETKATTKECWILKWCTDREERIDYYFNLKCVAWMPLPEPYKGEEP